MKTLRKTPDDLWAQREPLIPPRPDRSKGGRPPANDRQLFDGLFYLLRTGAAWREMPPEYGPWTTVYDRFREWRDAQVFARLWAKCLPYYEANTVGKGIGKAATARMCARPWAEKNGPHPTDRAKPGMKDHVLVDGRGVPVSVVVTAANINDHLALPELLTNHAVVRPRPTVVAPQHRCRDAAYDNEPTRQRLCREYYVPHIAPTGGRPDDAPLHPGGQARRWVVARTLGLIAFAAWLSIGRNCSRVAMPCFVWLMLSRPFVSSLRTLTKPRSREFIRFGLVQQINLLLRETYRISVTPKYGTNTSGTFTEPSAC